MEYIISEGFLDCILEKLRGDYSVGACWVEENIKDFLKSRQPVELVAEGEVGVDNFACAFLINGKTINSHFPAERIVGNNIKIYIQKAGK